MNQIMDNAYTVTSNLFGPESGIPWWVWVFVVGAIMFKLLVPAPKTARDIADERDQMMLNELLGWEMRWYKPAWGTLSTFYFASLAWLFTPRLFIPAVQMYFTALLMVRFRDADNLIYGVSWWLALMGIAYRVRLREGTR